MEVLPSQDESQIAAIIPKLGKDVVLLQRMTGRERLGDLFEYRLELLSVDDGIKLQDVLGEKVSVSVKAPDNEMRYFHGHVTSFSYAGRQGIYARYLATVRPWLWFLTLRSDCRIHQETTVPDIIHEAIRRHGFPDVEDRLVAEYRAWDYNVQYRETDFTYLSRLMEQEGIYYYFKHEEGKHVMVLADAGLAHGAVPGYETLPFVPVEDAGELFEHVSDWSVAQQVEPQAIGFRDFDFQGPRSNLETKIATLSEFQSEGVPSSSELELYDYPGEYESAEEGEAYARLRMEEFEARYEIAEGRTNAVGLAVGALFELTDHPRAEENREYLVVSADYELESNAYQTVRDKREAEPSFKCRFRAIDAGRRYRSRRTTPLPKVRGPQTAIVVGPEGEKVWPDKYGRVKVHFHWDRYRQKEENSSCWIRVSQTWAGGTWGAMHIPHVGQEVVVEFLEGDPDRPLITGRVYNAAQMPPLKLPDNKYKSVLRDDYGNQIVFDATPGEEHIFLYSPHHSSGMQIGKSVGSYSDSDMGDLKLGNQWSFGAGTKLDGYIGHAVTVDAGLAANVGLGVVCDIFAGGSYSLDFGLHAGWNMFPVVQTSDAEYLVTAKKDYIVGAGDDLCLAASLMQPLGALTKHTSVIRMNDDLALSVGEELEPADPLKNAPWADMGSAPDPFITLGGLAIGAVFGAMTGAAIHALDAKGTGDFARDFVDKYAAGTFLVTGEAISVWLAAAAMFWLHEMTKDDEIEPVKHKAPKASITMSKKGKIKIDGEGIMVSSDGDVFVKSDGAITFSADKSVWAKGKLEHPNFTVLA